MTVPVRLRPAGLGSSLHQLAGPGGTFVPEGLEKSLKKLLFSFILKKPDQFAQQLAFLRRESLLSIAGQSVLQRRSPRSAPFMSPADKPVALKQCKMFTERCPGQAGTPGKLLNVCSAKALDAVQDLGFGVE